MSALSIYFSTYVKTNLYTIYLNLGIKTTAKIVILDNVWAPRAHLEDGHESYPASVQHDDELPVQVHDTTGEAASLHIPGPNSHSSRTVHRQVRDNFAEEHQLTVVVQLVPLSLGASKKQSVIQIRHSTSVQTILPGSEILGKV